MFYIVVIPFLLAVKDCIGDQVISLYTIKLLLKSKLVKNQFSVYFLDRLVLTSPTKTRQKDEPDDLTRQDGGQYNFIEPWKLHTN